MDQIVFYWAGEKLELPFFLVKSIRLIYNQEIKIIQLSDNLTKQVNGVDEIIRIKPTNYMMLDRTFAYSLVKTKNNKTLFLDADSLVLNKINLDTYKKGIYLTKRQTNFLINYNSPEYYPEFLNKHFNEVMPYLFGIILIVDEEFFFENIIDILKKLPSRFHRWYGDQYSLKKLYDKGIIKFKFLNSDFTYIAEFDGKTKKINLDLLRSNKVLTFKGGKKNYMRAVFKRLTNL